MSDVPSPAERIRIVLVGTQHPGNLGSAARAMRTMGLTRMAVSYTHLTLPTNREV